LNKNERESALKIHGFWRLRGHPQTRLRRWIYRSLGTIRLTRCDDEPSIS
jgi:hypothetical protein